MIDFGSGWKESSVPPGQILLLSALIFIPSLSPSLFGWLNGLLAIPVFYLLVINGYNKGKKQIILSLLMAGLGALLMRRLEIFLFSLTLIPLGLTLFKSASTQESAAMSGAKGLVALSLTWLFFWGIYGATAGINPYSHLLTVLDLGFQQTLELYSAKEAGLSPEMVLNLTLVTTVMRETVPKMLPGLLMSMVIITVWINMVLANSLTGRLTGIAPWDRFATWKLPEQLVWMPITGIVVILVGQGFFQEVGGWLLMIAGLIYFFQGLAVFISLLERWRVPLFVRVILYVLFIIQSYGLILLAVLGLSDIWFNLREKTEQQ